MIYHLKKIFNLTMDDGLSMAHYDLQRLIHYFNIELPVEQVGMMSFYMAEKINQLKMDSRLIKSNDIFIALPGYTVDGKEFIPQAIAAGAIAVLIETDDKQQDKQIGFYTQQNKYTPLIYIYQLSKYLSALADDFYDHPSEKLRVVGVTGTNGKTTISQLIAQWVELLGEKTAVLGTLGNGVYNHLTPSANTTPSPVEIQAYLADFYQNDVKLVAMEISSHGLVLDRVKAITFAATVFTNISRDHLDFHQTMKNYQQAKWSLFSPNAEESAVKSPGKRIINYDDVVGQQWISVLNDVVVVSSKPENLSIIKTFGKAYIGVSKVSYHDKGITIELESSYGKAQLSSALFGAFNVSNLLLAFATLLTLNYPFVELVDTAARLVPVSGRMEIFTAVHKPTVIVDYAHTPDALDKALSATKEHCHGKLWVIFGCGGDRDKGKRALMAQVAEQYTNNIIVTNDNPRTEDQDEIVADILKGFTKLMTWQIIKDRTQAIAYAITQSQEKDIILVAGKGHEDYQIIGKQKYHYSDRETVCRLLGI